MVKAISISKLLAVIEAIFQGESNGTEIYISSHNLKQVLLDKDAATEALKVLATENDYKCIKIIDDKVRKDHLASITLLDNFQETKKAFIAYINYLRDKNKSDEFFPNTDWPSLEKRFLKKDSVVNWGIDGVTNPDVPLITRVKDYNCVLRLIGNDVVLEFNDASYGIIKTLRTDQAPFFFLKYLIMHADQVIPKTVIQTEVEMCSQKTDMTELVRQCGISKELKKHFFNGTTKDKVVFTPYAKVSLQTASESYI